MYGLQTWTSIHMWAIALRAPSIAGESLGSLSQWILQESDTESSKGGCQEIIVAWGRCSVLHTDYTEYPFFKQVQIYASKHLCTYVQLQ